MKCSSFHLKYDFGQITQPLKPHCPHIWDTVLGVRGDWWLGECLLKTQKQEPLKDTGTDCDLPGVCLYEEDV